MLASMCFFPELKGTVMTELQHLADSSGTLLPTLLLVINSVQAHSSSDEGISEYTLTIAPLHCSLKLMLI